MKNNPVSIDVSKAKRKKEIKVDANTIFSHFTSITLKLTTLKYNQEPNNNGVDLLLSVIDDFVDIIGAFTITKSMDNLVWSLIKNSLVNATKELLSDLNIKFANKNIQEDAIYAIKEAKNVTFDYEFLHNPAKSEISRFYCNKLCYWLSLMVSEKNIQQIKKNWSIYFTKAVTIEFIKNEQYKKVIEYFGVPTREALEALKNLQEYQNEIIKFSNQQVFEEDIQLEKIYIDLYGVFDNSRDFNHEFLNVRMGLTKWVNNGNENICIVRGEPGSGKSTVMKMLAVCLAQSGHRVIFIDLFKVNFSTKKSALDVLMEYIKKIVWLKNYDFENDVPLVMILDGLDEIRVDVWNNAIELLRELKNSIWNEHHKVIVSGRKKIMDYCSAVTENILSVEVLPLHFGDDDNKRIDPKKLLKYLKDDLRVIYWNKLCEAFDIKYDVNNIILGEHLKELSTSPLLLFLLAWTIKYSDMPITRIQHSVDLYNKILNCVYTRKYNRNKKDYEEYAYDEFQNMLSITGLCAWQNDSRNINISLMEKSCIKRGKEELFKRWVDYHKINNPSKLVLLFFFREKLNKNDYSESEIEFIHKTFYEYLAAIAVLDELLIISKFSGKDFQIRIFELLSKNLLSVEIIEFIEGLLDCGTIVSLSEYAHVISSIFPRVFNVNWPINISKDEIEGFVTVENYNELKQCINNIEENMIRLAEIVPNAVAWKKPEENIQLLLESSNLQQINLMWKSLHNTNFNGTDFSDSILTNCELYECNLKHCDFEKSLLNSCYLNSAELDNSRFTSAHLEAASLCDVILNDVSFNDAKLEGASFCDSTLNNVDFCGASIMAADFDNCILKNINFTDANLERANLNGIIIENVIWDNCSLKDAKLHNVKMKQFDLTNEEIKTMLLEADLDNADWEEVSLEIRSIFLK